MDGQHASADPSPRPGADAVDPLDVAGRATDADALAADTDADGTDAQADGGDAQADGADMQTDGVDVQATEADDADGAEADPAGAHREADAAAGAIGERSARPRKPRREKSKRDPHETPFGGYFLDELQRLAGLRGQFAYGVPEKLWRANREQTIRILREEVPMPTFKNQIHCILNSDPVLLAQDVHYEMLASATPPEDSFRWLWLYMMLR